MSWVYLFYCMFFFMVSIFCELFIKEGLGYHYFLTHYVGLDFASSLIKKNIQPSEEVSWQHAAEDIKHVISLLEEI